MMGTDPLSTPNPATDQWLIRTSQNIIAGPYTREQVCHLIEDQKLGPDDEVCPANGYWIYLHEEEELLRQLGVKLPHAYGPASEEEITQTQTDTLTETQAEAEAGVGAGVGSPTGLGRDSDHGRDPAQGPGGLRGSAHAPGEGSEARHGSNGYRDTASGVGAGSEASAPPRILLAAVAIAIAVVLIFVLKWLRG